MVREATDICLRVLKESNKSRFDSFSRYEQCIDHITYYLSRLSRAHFFRQPFSKQLYMPVGYFFQSRFSAGKISPISIIFGILNKEWSNFNKLLIAYLFSCRYKNV